MSSFSVDDDNIGFVVSRRLAALKRDWLMTFFDVAASANIFVGQPLRLESSADFRYCAVSSSSTSASIVVSTVRDCWTGRLGRRRARLTILINCRMTHLIRSIGT